MFISLNPSTLSLSLPFADALRLARAHDFAALDLPLDELLQLATQHSTAWIKEQFAQAGVRPGGWSLPVNFRVDEETFQAGLAQLSRYAALAQELGSPWCYTWLLPFSDELAYEENMTRHVQRLRPVARILADHGCRFGLEFVGSTPFRSGHTYTFIHTLAETLTLGSAIGTGNCGLLLDSFHWYTSHSTVEEILRLNADQVVYVHVNDARPGRSVDEQLDNERLLPAASSLIDIAGFLQALHKIGYDGPVAVEPFDNSLKGLSADDRIRQARAALTQSWRLASL